MISPNQVKMHFRKEEWPKVSGIAENSCRGELRNDC